MAAIILGVIWAVVTVILYPDIALFAWLRIALVVSIGLNLGVRTALRLQRGGR